MRIIALATLRDFWLRHPESETPLRAWHAIASRAQWSSPADVRQAYRTASIVSGNRIVFDIGGNRYRLVVAAHYDRGILFVRFVGSHAEYDRIDVTAI
ncbi:MAG TPA: type II toxin-antitoxin system HigB family toxin [Usitatibacteraceae bacterium]|jgi:mRNA interferase HigB|nr:type II toxin-antitoxin system HigB family toxin [Usitatibacteraceae bacterium]